MTLKQELRAALANAADDALDGPIEIDNYGEAWYWTDKGRTIVNAASMLEKLLPGENGEFSEELIERVARLLKRNAGAGSRDYNSPTEDFYDDSFEILAAIVATLTDTKEGE